MKMALQAQVSELYIVGLRLLILFNSEDLIYDQAFIVISNIRNEVTLTYSVFFDLDQILVYIGIRFIYLLHGKCF